MPTARPMMSGRLATTNTAVTSSVAPIHSARRVRPAEAGASVIVRRNPPHRGGATRPRLLYHGPWTAYPPTDVESPIPSHRRGARGGRRVRGARVVDIVPVARRACAAAARRIRLATGLGDRGGALALVRHTGVAPPDGDRDCAQ